MSDAQQQLIDTLQQRLGFQVVTKSFTDKQVRLEGRVPRAHEQGWRPAMQHLLIAAASAPWSVDVSQHYFVPDNLVMVYSWRLIFQADSIADHLHSIIGHVRNAPRVRREVDEQPLPGVSGQRTMMNTRGKGASSAGSVPLIVRQRSGV